MQIVLAGGIYNLLGLLFNHYLFPRETIDRALEQTYSNNDDHTKGKGTGWGLVDFLALGLALKLV